MDSVSESRLVIRGTAAERAAMDTTNLKTLDRFIETDTSNEYTWDGDSWAQSKANGAAHVADVGRAGQAHNRIITTGGNAVATDIGTATWTEAESVYACRFRVYGGTPGNEIKLVFDASPVDDSSDTTQAENWLTTAAAAEATDVEYFLVSMAGDAAAQVGPVGVPEWSEWFQFSSPLRRCDVVALSIDEALTIFIEVA